MMFMAGVRGWPRPSNSKPFLVKVFVKRNALLTSSTASSSESVIFGELMAANAVRFPPVAVSVFVWSQQG